MPDFDIFQRTVKDDSRVRAERARLKHEVPSLQPERKPSGSVAHNSASEYATDEEQEINALPGNNQFETRVIKASDASLNTMASFLRRALASGKASSFMYSITDRENPRRAQPLIDLITGLMKERSDFKGRYITDIQKENVEYVKKIIATGVEVRHIEGNRISFSVSNTEYLNHYQEYLEEGDNKTETRSWIWSNNPDLVSQMQDMFQTLWEQSMPSALRIKQIEQGLANQETRIVTSHEEMRKLNFGMVETCHSEALYIIASEKVFERNLTLLQKLADLQAERGFSIRILAPISAKQHGLLEQIFDFSEKIEWRKTEPVEMTLAIFDRNKMCMTQYLSIEAQDWENAIFSNIYSTNIHTVSGFVSIFEALWKASELQEKERQTRRQAELLQDILAHDIRNYNQIVRLGSELLNEEISGNENVRPILNSILSAIDGSTQLLERAKKLGKALSEYRPNLYPVNVLDTIKESLSLVRAIYPDEKIIEEQKLRFAQSTESERMKNSLMVMADDLLGEAIVNVYSNCVKYSRGGKISIETTIDVVNGERNPEQVSGLRSLSSGDGPTSFVKISIADEGKGIPDQLKSRLFSRYLENAKGSGLGLSIVHALVVNRYNGKISVRNRIPEDYTKGTVVEIWLPKA